MDDDGGSLRFKKRGPRDRTSCLVTGLGIGMVLALMADSMLLGIFSGVIIGLGMEAFTRRGVRLNNPNSSAKTLEES